MKLAKYIIWEIRDKHGQIISVTKHEVHSIVRGFIDTLHVQMGQVAVTNGAVATDGATRNTGTGVNNFAADNAAASGTYGLVVGTGSGAVTISDYALGAKIAHGSGAGQLSHGGTTFTNPTTSGSTRSFTIQRTFTNNSGSDITVNEVGIYIKMSTYILLMDRTLSTKTITNGTTGTLTYTLGVTV